MTVSSESAAAVNTRVFSLDASHLQAPAYATHNDRSNSVVVAKTDERGDIQE